MKSKYSKEEINIINEILEEIFDVLNCESYEKQTYLGYFQTIVNYLLLFGTKVIIDFLFKDSPPIISKLYSHLKNSSIQNILENNLNILSYYEDNKNFFVGQKKYIKIIYDLLAQLKEDEKFEKAEFICDLIINTLVYNSDKHLIGLIFDDDTKSIMENIKDIIQKIINKENNNKKLIPIIQLLCHLNNSFIRSFNDYSFPQSEKPSFLDSLNNGNIKVNFFEYQNYRNKIVSSSLLLKAFKNNIFKYLKYINDIYMIFARDIGKKWGNNYDNNKICNNSKANENKENKVFNLENLYEWKYILSSLKIYIISFYKTGFSDYGYKHYFFDEKLFEFSMELYLNYKENNIYRNIFLEIIKLICDERCPKYLIRPFLSLKGENKKSNFIINIVNKIHELNSSYKKNVKKDNISVETLLEILNCFFSSSNKKILKHFDKNVDENKLE